MKLLLFVLGAFTLAAFGTAAAFSIIQNWDKICDYYGDFTRVQLLVELGCYGLILLIVFLSLWGVTTLVRNW